MTLFKPACFLVLLALPGCGALLTEGASDLAGIGATGISSSVSSNANVAAAIGLGVQSLASTGLKYATRRIHANEQDAIAQAAGPLEPGAVSRWSIVHTVPIEADEHGDVSVSRVFGAGPIQCKEVVFSVETTEKKQVRRAFYVTSICNDGTNWRWAGAEPATPRWGGLQ